MYHLIKKRRMDINGMVVEPRPWGFFRHGVEVPMTRDDDPMESKPSSKAG